MVQALPYMEDLRMKTNEVESVKQALTPLIRMLLHKGVNYKTFCEIAKQLFVEIALNEFGIKGRPTNASRVAILTGIDRKQVKKIQEQSAVKTQMPTQDASTISRVLSAWHHEADFTDENGKAKDLNEEQFFILTAKYGGDIPPKAILKELQQSRCIERLENGQLRAKSKVFIPRSDKAMAISRAVSVVSDIGNTLCHNIFTQSNKDHSPHFERRAVNHAIPAEKLEAFNQFVSERGQALLEEVDTWLSENELSISCTEGKTIRLGLGAYLIQSDIN